VDVRVAAAVEGARELLRRIIWREGRDHMNRIEYTCTACGTTLAAGERDGHYCHGVRVIADLEALR